MAQAMENIRQDPGIRLVDVRSPGEYREGHLPGSLSIPLDDLGQVRRLIPETGATIYAYCASGARSAMAVGLLKRMGYSQVQNIGGITSYPGELER